MLRFTCAHLLVNLAFCRNIQMLLRFYSFSCDAMIDNKSLTRASSKLNARSGASYRHTGLLQHVRLNERAMRLLLLRSCFCIRAPHSRMYLGAPLAVEFFTRPK